VDPDATWGATSSSSGGGLRQLQRELTQEELQAVAATNREWLEECLVLLLCVLALDQYADYSADQVRKMGRQQPPFGTWFELRIVKQQCSVIQHRALRVLPFVMSSTCTCMCRNESGRLMWSLCVHGSLLCPCMG
jgi:hypothetical protein